MELKFRFATIRELDIYFKWTNDPLVRQHSFNSEPVSFNHHENWFKSKLHSESCFLYFFSSGNLPVGQVRIERGSDENIIGISLDENFRGKSLSSVLLLNATEDFLESNPGQKITAYIKTENEASYKGFIKAGFSVSDSLIMKDVECYRLIKQ